VTCVRASTDAPRTSRSRSTPVAGDAIRHVTVEPCARRVVLTRHVPRVVAAFSERVPATAADPVRPEPEAGVAAAAGAAPRGAGAASPAGGVSGADGGAGPLPVSGASVVPAAVLSASASVASRGPVADGVKRTPMSHVAPGATGAPEHDSDVTT
jgi:hypothetical protein